MSFQEFSVSQVSYLCTFFKYSLPIAEICTVQYVQIPGSIYFVVDRELPPPYFICIFVKVRLVSVGNNTVKHPAQYLS